MTALAADKLNFRRRRVGERNFPLAANVVLWQGGMVSLDNTGYLRPTRSTATDLVLGYVKDQVYNIGGIAGAISADVESDLALCVNNSAAADAISLTDIGKDCYAVDDQTAALTSAGNTRPRIGKIQNVTSDGVWVRFDQ